MCVGKCLLLVVALNHEFFMKILFSFWATNEKQENNFSRFGWENTKWTAEQGWSRKSLRCWRSSTFSCPESREKKDSAKFICLPDCHKNDFASAVKCATFVNRKSTPEDFFSLFYLFLTTRRAGEQFALIAIDKFHLIVCKRSEF